MKRIITYGTYDLLHFGHIDFLKRAKNMGDYLIVSLADEKYNLAHSKKDVISLLKRESLC